MSELIDFASRYKQESSPYATLHENELATRKALLVFAFLEKWGMVQGVDAGEDSAGRAKTGLMPVEETVNRAIEMVNYAWEKLKENGDILVSPSYKELLEKYNMKRKLEEDAAYEEMLDKEDR